MFAGSTLAAVSEGGGATTSHSANLSSASSLTLTALGQVGALMRSLMQSHVRGEAPISLSTPYMRTAGYRGDPSHLLCSHQSDQSEHQITPSADESGSDWCHFHIPASLTAHLRTQRSDVVQVLLDMDGVLESSYLLTAADPPISTSLVAMELTSPQGESIHVRDLDPAEAIRVVLPNRNPVGQSSAGDSDSRTCLTVTLPSDGQLNFTVNSLDGLDQNAGLYLSLNFSLDPGAVDLFPLSPHGIN